MSSSSLSLLALLAITLLPAVARAGGLNDTGIVFCGAHPLGNTAAPCTPSPAGQDTHFGRDAAAQAGVLTKIGGSADPANGFDYTKIANNGTELPASATLGTEATDWACTRDNVTGLVWEVKVDNAIHMRHQGHSYTWYDPASPDGNTGTVGATATCNATLGVSECNTTHYAAGVNSVGLCGHSDWRMPSVKELEGIWDLNRTAPAIDPDYFPNTPDSFFWSGSPYAGSSDSAWYVYFSFGYANDHYRSDAYHVRLVRGGQ